MNDLDKAIIELKNIIEKEKDVIKKMELEDKLNQFVSYIEVTRYMTRFFQLMSVNTEQVH